MQAIPKSTGLVSPEEYLEGERLSDVRHEYVDGHVYAMAGASDDHNRIARNLGAQLTNRFAGGPCEAFITDLKLKPSPMADVYYYPDLMVVCDSSDNQRYFRERPSIVVEVTSPETRRADLHEKLFAYQAIPSLICYAILEQDTVQATIHRRTEQGWTREVIEGPEALLPLPGVQPDIPLRAVYDRTSALAASSLKPHRDQN